jgi:hypothetical protein
MEEENGERKSSRKAENKHHVIIADGKVSIGARRCNVAHNGGTGIWPMRASHRIPQQVLAGLNANVLAKLGAATLCAFVPGAALPPRHGRFPPDSTTVLVRSRSTIRAINGAKLSLGPHLHARPGGKCPGNGEGGRASEGERG